MERKKRTTATEITESLLKFREKRKWQISLRRYVLDKNPCVFYAPYFGLDIENMRNWFEIQFTNETWWKDFGKKWQFDHIVPVAYFDFSVDSQLKLCWNFTNLRVETFEKNKNRGNRLDVIAAKHYFTDLYQATGYTLCEEMLKMIDKIELPELLSNEKQKEFIKRNKSYLEMIETYTSFEFELLNSGRSIIEVKKEIEFFKKFQS